MEDVQNTVLKNCVLTGRHRTSYKAVNLNGVASDIECLRTQEKGVVSGLVGEARCVHVW